MSGYRLNLRKTGKNILNIVPLLLVMLCTVLLYYSSVRSVKMGGLSEPKRETPAVYAGQLQSALGSIDSQGEWYPLFTAQIAEEQEKMKAGKAEEDWKAFLLMRIFEEYKRMAEDSAQYAPDSAVMLEHRKEIAYDRYYYEHPELTFTERRNHSSGTGFLFYMMDEMIPVFLLLIMIFILGNTYCSGYYEQISIRHLLPVSFRKKWIADILSGMTVFLGAAVILVLICVLPGTVYAGFGGFSVPVCTWIEENTVKYVSAGSLIPSIAVLLLFTALFVSSFIRCASAVCRKSMYTLFLCIAVLIGTEIAVWRFAPLHSTASVNPMTYLNPLRIVTGQFMYTSGNMSITLLNGCAVLTIWSLVLMMTAYMAERAH